MRNRLLTMALAGVLLAGTVVAGTPGAAVAGGPGGLTFASVSAPLAPVSAPHVLGPYYGLVRDFGLQSRLDLTADQEQAVRDLLDENAKTQIELASELQVKQVELRQLLEKEEFDLKSIDKAVDAINSLQASMLKSEIRTVALVRDVLTPEQNAVLEGAVRPPVR